MNQASFLPFLLCQMLANYSQNLFYSVRNREHFPFLSLTSWSVTVAYSLIFHLKYGSCLQPKQSNWKQCAHGLWLPWYSSKPMLWGGFISRLPKSIAHLYFIYEAGSFRNRSFWRKKMTSEYVLQFVIEIAIRRGHFGNLLELVLTFHLKTRTKEGFDMLWFHQQKLNARFRSLKLRYVSNEK